MSRFTQRTPVGRPTWIVLIFQVATHDSQQRILRRIALLGRTDITVLGVCGGADYFLVAECPGLREQALLGWWISSIDGTARLLHGTREPARRSISPLREHELDASTDPILQ